MAAADTLDAGAAPDTLADPVARLRSRRLTLPVEGVPHEALRDDFHQPRSGGRVHRAIDILAPRGTPVVAVEDGTIISTSPSTGAGGIVVQQLDSSGRYVYAYAHLERWASWIATGMKVFRGQVLGYVGSTGNATTPHLHFTIAPVEDDGRPSRSVRLNPFQILR
ncbi:MAG TPA: M23 family metallopeptidase [Gemmatimonadota bacterium]|nr:M23 family metallopeptidase [Gemmatimonadota bacterium]